MILDVDIEHHSISLSIKQCVDNPWANIVDEYMAGDTVVGNIKKIGSFGITVGLKSGIDGIVHMSKISKNSQMLKSKAALSNYNVGDEVSVIILDVNPEKESVSLSIKQKASDPIGQNITLNNFGAVEGDRDIKGARNE
jgi:small subunit ribosomal protein S1